MNKYIFIKKQGRAGFISLPKEWNCSINMELISTDKQLEKLLKANANIQEIEIKSLSKESKVEEPPFPKHIFIRENDRFRKIMFQEILFIEAAGSYCSIHLANGKKIFLSMNLSHVSKKLPPLQFIRVHRSYAVNIEHINALDGSLLYINRIKIPVSRQHIGEVRNKLNVLTGTLPPSI